MFKGLHGKNVLVTGSTSGIGQAIAIRFAEEGCNVAINFRNKPSEANETEKMARMAQMMETMGQHGHAVVPVQGDIAREEDVVRMVEETIKKLGGLDILINNAGIQTSKSSHELEMADFDRVLNVNLRGAFMCARQSIQHWLATNKPGTIINISSVHQIVPKPKYIGYSASKGAMANLTRTLALEYAGNGIRVNAIGPGATVTPINRAWVDDPLKRQQVTSHIPLDRVGTSEEMAAVTAFLCSDEASYITGQTLYVDGGLTLFADFRTAWSSE